MTTGTGHPQRSTPPSPPGTVSAAGRSPRAAVQLLALGLVLGAAWGAATSGMQTVLPTPVQGLANAVSPWVVPSFVVGALSRGWRVALVAGVLACAGQVVGYYGVSDLRGFGVFGPTVVRWLVAAVPGGLVFAAAGHLWRRSTGPGRSGLGAALLACCFLTEGLLLYGWVLRYPGDAVVFCVIGTLLPVLLAVLHPSARREPHPVARRRRQLVLLRATALWAAPVLLLGAAGQAVALHVLGQPVEVTSVGAQPGDLTDGADGPPPA